MAAPTDPELASILEAVQDADRADALLDNQGIADVLGLSLDVVAERLQEAKQRSLVWGIRSGQQPAPWYTDLEVTVQGRRFLAAHTTAP
jgi:hypothetical protein